MKIALLLMSLLSFLGITASAQIDVGAALPDVDCPDENGAIVNLGKTHSTGFVLVYFYPKADTPGCTKQACNLRDAFAELTAEKVQVFGVSHDNAAAQKAFKEKYQLPFTLLADSESVVAKAFGVPAVAGITKRQAFLFLDGKLLWRDLAATPTKQAEDVLAVVRKSL